MSENPYLQYAIDMMRSAVKRRDEPVKLSSGEHTWVYLDVKGVLVDRRRMNTAADAMIRHIAQFRPTAIGGPTMGGDVLSHVIVSRDWFHDGRLSWFSVREPKTTHGLGLSIEGHRLAEHDRVVITDDVASTGRSLIEAVEEVKATGAEIVGIAPFVDRSGLIQDRLTEAGITAPYAPLMTYVDLGLGPLGT